MPSISPGQTSPHACAQFLNQVLSRPNALPYEEDLKWSIRQHLVSVIQQFPGLQARIAVFNHNDGRQVNLLQADGTIPMYYQDVKYNIPVTIWLLEQYPRKCPLVYVSPTRDMIIKPRHRMVDASGMVEVPYLQQWLFPRSNLVELVQNLSLHFGLDPPLYSKPATPFASPHQQQQQQQQNTPPPLPPTPPPPPQQQQQYVSAAPSSRPPYPPPYFQQQQQQQPPQPRTDDPAEVFKKNAVSTLTGRLQQDVAALRRSLEVEMEDMFNVQAHLNQRAEQLGKVVGEFEREKEGLEQQLQLLHTNTDVLETWLSSNSVASASAAARSSAGIDDAFVPVDALSKQMLECSAEDLAIEDLLYALDKGVQEGVITAEAYLKHVRTLAREQFFFRATSAKVRTAQMQVQVASMAARAPPYLSSS